MQLFSHATAIALVHKSSGLIAGATQSLPLVKAVRAYLAITTPVDPLPEGRADAPDADSCAT